MDIFLGLLFVMGVLGAGFYFIRRKMNATPTPTATSTDAGGSDKANKSKANKR